MDFGSFENTIDKNIETDKASPDFVIASPKKNKSSNIPQRECDI